MYAKYTSLVSLWLPLGIPYGLEPSLCSYLIVRSLHVPFPIRLSILKSALNAIIKLLKPRGCKPKVSGLYYDWYSRIYLFLKPQVQQEQKVLQATDLFTCKVHALQYRKVLAKKVADGRGWG